MEQSKRAKSSPTEKEPPQKKQSSRRKKTSLKPGKAGSTQPSPKKKAPPTQKFKEALPTKLRPNGPDRETTADEKLLEKGVVPGLVRTEVPKADPVPTESYEGQMKSTDATDAGQTDAGREESQEEIKDGSYLRTTMPPPDPTGGK